CFAGGSAASSEPVPGAGSWSGRVVAVTSSSSASAGVAASGACWVVVTGILRVGRSGGGDCVDIELEQQALVELVGAADDLPQLRGEGLWRGLELDVVDLGDITDLVDEQGDR